jgi:hypothetical protein
MREIPTSSCDAGVSSRAPHWRTGLWFAGSLTCSLASIVSHGYALSLASHAAMAVAKREQIPDTWSLMSGLFQLAPVLALAGLVFGVPVVRRGGSVGRVAVVVGFLAAVAFMFVMV